jgi:hypothetical protein
MTNVVVVVSDMFNSIRCEGMNRRQFKDFSSNMESEYGHVLCCTEVRWLFCGRMLNPLKTEFLHNFI